MTGARICGECSGATVVMFEMQAPVGQPAWFLCFRCYRESVREARELRERNAK